jgi:RsiW-degrading membrane proteinase PrsW (M82 family)
MFGFLNPVAMNDTVMLVVYVILALFIAWIWVDYFRLIDVFEKENLLRVGVTFLLGAGSTQLVLGLHEIWTDPFGLYMNGEFVNDFLYCTFGIGLVEEVAKSIPVLIAFWLFRKHINEPIDYIATFSVAALGFAAAENVLYFTSYGAEIISSRAILSNVGHMLFASLTAYGVVLVKFRNLKPGFIIIPLLLLAASVFHGIYDFGLMYVNAGWSGTIVTILFFLLGVSAFATILNNALNISPFFTYKHAVHSSNIALRMLTYYAILFVMQCFVVVAVADVPTMIGLVFRSVWTILPIILITVLRLSRFKLIHGRWNLIKPELPFGIAFKKPDNQPGFFIGVKGNPYSDYHMTQHFEAYLFLCPVAPNSHYLRQPRTAYIFKKLYLNGDVAHYAARVYIDDTMQQTQTVLLQLSRTYSVWNKQPLVAVLYSENSEQLDTTKVPVSLTFIEWATIQPAPNIPSAQVNAQ